MAQVSIFSDKWFDMVEKTTAKVGDLNMTPAMKGICLNIIVTPNTEKTEQTELSQQNEEGHELYLSEGSLYKGQHDNARSTMTTDYATMKTLLAGMDMSKATQAFINGEIRVSGDMSQLMALQMTKVSDEQQLLFKTILENTKVD